MTLGYIELHCGRDEMHFWQHQIKFKTLPNIDCVTLLYPPEIISISVFFFLKVKSRNVFGGEVIRFRIETCQLRHVC